MQLRSLGYGQAHTAGSYELPAKNELVETYDKDRRCRNCAAKLSRYNPIWLCAACDRLLEQEVKLL